MSDPAHDFFAGQQYVRNGGHPTYIPTFNPHAIAGACAEYNQQETSKNNIGESGNDWDDPGIGLTALIGIVLGLVAMTHFSPSNPSATSAAALSTNNGSEIVSYATVNVERLNLRACPDTKCRVVMTMPRGMRVRIIAELANEWVAIDTSDADGQPGRDYANGKYMEF